MIKPLKWSTVDHFFGVFDSINFIQTTLLCVVRASYSLRKTKNTSHNFVILKQQQQQNKINLINFDV